MAWATTLETYRRGLVRLVDGDARRALDEWASAGKAAQQDLERAPAFVYNRGLARLRVGDLAGASEDFDRLRLDLAAAAVAVADKGLDRLAKAAERGLEAVQELARGTGQTDQPSYQELVARQVAEARRAGRRLTAALLAGPDVPPERRRAAEELLARLATVDFTIVTAAAVTTGRVAPDVILGADWPETVRLLRLANGAVPGLLCWDAPPANLARSGRRAVHGRDAVSAVRAHLIGQPCRLIAADGTVASRLSEEYGRSSMATLDEPPGPSGDSGAADGRLLHLAMLLWIEALGLRPDVEPLLSSMSRAEAAQDGTRTPRISLCLIARNEETNLLRCLASAEGVAEEVIVGDTGSTDRTRLIAAALGAKVIDVPWKGDFSAARNAVLEAATGEWILQLDADEELAPGDGLVLCRLSRSEGAVDAYYVTDRSILGTGPGGSSVDARLLRFFRAGPTYRYEGRIHEQILPSILAAGGRVAVSPVVLHHYGYLVQEVAAKDKINRNLTLIEEALRKEPHNAYLGYQLAMEQMRAGDLEKAAKNLDIVARFVLDTRPDLLRKEDFALVTSLSAVEASLAAGHPQRALELADRFVAAIPGYAELGLARGRVLAALGRYGEAVAQFVRCTTMDGSPTAFPYRRDGATTWQPWLELGRVYQAISQRAEAVAAYRQAVVHGAGGVAALEPLASLILDAEDPDKALPYLRRLMSNLDGKHRLWAAGLLAKVLIGRRRLEEAESLLDEEMAIGRDHLDDDGEGPAIARFWLGVIRERQRCYAQAAAIFADLEGEPALGREPIWRRAICLILGGRPEQVPDCLEPVLAAAPVQAHLYLKLADTVGRKSAGRPAVRPPAVDGPLPAFDGPEGRRAFTYLVHHLLELGEESALDALLELGRLVYPDPGDEDRAVGKVYFQLGDADRAMFHLVRATQAGSADGESLAILGQLAWGKGLSSDAVEFLQRSAKADPARVETHLHLATALAEMGRHREALAAVREALAGPCAGHRALLAMERRLAAAP